jgi:hypothetical protein
VARTGKKGSGNRISAGKPDGKRSLRKLGTGGKIILTLILKRCWKVSTGYIWLRIWISVVVL